MSLRAHFLAIFILLLIFGGVSMYSQLASAQSAFGGASAVGDSAASAPAPTVTGSSGDGGANVQCNPVKKECGCGHVKDPKTQKCVKGENKWKCSCVATVGKGTQNGICEEQNKCLGTTYSGSQGSGKDAITGAVKDALKGALGAGQGAQQGGGGGGGLPSMPTPPPDSGAAIQDQLKKDFAPFEQSGEDITKSVQNASRNDTLKQLSFDPTPLSQQTSNAFTSPPNDSFTAPWTGLNDQSLNPNLTSPPASADSTLDGNPQGSFGEPAERPFGSSGFQGNTINPNGGPSTGFSGPTPSSGGGGSNPEGGFFSNLTNAARNLFTGAVDAAKDIGSSIVDTAKSLGSSVADAAGNVASSIQDTWKNLTNGSNPAGLDSGTNPAEFTPTNTAPAEVSHTATPGETNTPTKTEEPSSLQGEPLQGKSAETLKEQMQELKDGVLDPTKEKIDAANRSITEQKAAFDKLAAERQQFIDRNAANVDKDGKITFAKQADVDALKNLNSEYSKAAESLKNDIASNQQRVAEYNERVGEFNQLQKEYEQLPAAARLISQMEDVNSDTSKPALEEVKFEAEKKAAELRLGNADKSIVDSFADELKAANAEKIAANTEKMIKVQEDTLRYLNQGESADKVAEKMLDPNTPKNVRDEIGREIQEWNKNNAALADANKLANTDERTRADDILQNEVNRQQALVDLNEKRLAELSGAPPMSDTTRRALDAAAGKTDNPFQAAVWAASNTLHTLQALVSGGLESQFASALGEAFPSADPEIVGGLAARLGDTSQASLLSAVPGFAAAAVDDLARTIDLTANGIGLDPNLTTPTTQIQNLSTLGSDMVAKDALSVANTALNATLIAQAGNLALRGGLSAIGADTAAVFRNEAFGELLAGTGAEVRPLATLESPLGTGAMEAVRNPQTGVFEVRGAGSAGSEFTSAESATARGAGTDIATAESRAVTVPESLPTVESPSIVPKETPAVSNPFEQPFNPSNERFGAEASRSIENTFKDMNAFSAFTERGGGGAGGGSKLAESGSPEFVYEGVGGVGQEGRGALQTETKPQTISSEARGGDSGVPPETRTTEVTPEQRLLAETPQEFKDFLKQSIRPGESLTLRGEESVALPESLREAAYGKNAASVVDMPETVLNQLVAREILGSQIRAAESVSGELSQAEFQQLLNQPFKSSAGAGLSDAAPGAWAEGSNAATVARTEGVPAAAGEMAATQQPSFLQSAREMIFGASEIPTASSISPAEAAAVSNLNNALAQYSEPVPGNLAPAELQSIAAERAAGVSGAYEAIGAVGLSMGPDGSIVRADTGEAVGVSVGSSFQTTGSVEGAPSTPVTPAEVAAINGVNEIAAKQPLGGTEAQTNRLLAESGLERAGDRAIVRKETREVLAYDISPGPLGQAYALVPPAAAPVPAPNPSPSSLPAVPRSMSPMRAALAPTSLGLAAVFALGNPADVLAASGTIKKAECAAIGESCLRPVRGEVTFYDPRLGGINGSMKATANGEKPNVNADTFASQIYPMNTVVRVCNGDVCRYLRVNDTGAFAKLGRVADLTVGAAARVNLKGKAQLTLDPLGMFNTREMAEAVTNKLNKGATLADAIQKAKKETGGDLTVASARGKQEIANPALAQTVAPRVAGEIKIASNAWPAGIPGVVPDIVDTTAKAAAVTPAPKAASWPQVLPGTPKPATKPVQPSTGPATLESVVNDYLWKAYERTPKRDATGDFSWKDPAAAQKAGISLKDFVIGGLDLDFKINLYALGKSMDQAGLEWGLTSGFRDEYRQSLITSGVRGQPGRSYHDKGLAADITGVGKTNPQQVWDFIQEYGARFGVARPYLEGRVYDPPHVVPLNSPEYTNKYDIRGLPRYENTVAAEKKLINADVARITMESNSAASQTKPTPIVIKPPTTKPIIGTADELDTILTFNPNASNVTPVQVALNGKTEFSLPQLLGNLTNPNKPLSTATKPQNPPQTNTAPTKPAESQQKPAITEAPVVIPPAPTLNVKVLQANVRSAKTNLDAMLKMAEQANKNHNTQGLEMLKVGLQYMARVESAVGNVAKTKEIDGAAKEALVKNLRSIAADRMAVEKIIQDFDIMRMKSELPVRIPRVLKLAQIVTTHAERAAQQAIVQAERQAEAVADAKIRAAEQKKRLATAEREAARRASEIPIVTEVDYTNDTPYRAEIPGSSVAEPVPEVSEIAVQPSRVLADNLIPIAIEMSKQRLQKMIDEFTEAALENRARNALTYVRERLIDRLGLNSPIQIAPMPQITAVGDDNSYADQQTLRDRLDNAPDTLPADQLVPQPIGVTQSGVDVTDRLRVAAENQHDAPAAPRENPTPFYDIIVPARAEGEMPPWQSVAGLTENPPPYPDRVRQPAEISGPVTGSLDTRTPIQGAVNTPTPSTQAITSINGQTIGTLDTRTPIRAVQTNPDTQNRNQPSSISGTVTGTLTEPLKGSVSVSSGTSNSQEDPLKDAIEALRLSVIEQRLGNMWKKIQDQLTRSDTNSHQSQTAETASNRLGEIRALPQNNVQMFTLKVVSAEQVADPVTIRIEAVKEDVNASGTANGLRSLSDSYDPETNTVRVMIAEADLKTWDETGVPPRELLVVPAPAGAGGGSIPPTYVGFDGNPATFTSQVSNGFGGGFTGGGSGNGGSGGGGGGNGPTFDFWHDASSGTWQTAPQMPSHIPSWSTLAAFAQIAANSEPKEPPIVSEGTNQAGGNASGDPTENPESKHAGSKITPTPVKTKGVGAGDTSEKPITGSEGTKPPEQLPNTAGPGAGEKGDTQDPAKPDPIKPDPIKAPSAPPKTTLYISQEMWQTILQTLTARSAPWQPSLAQQLGQMIGKLFAGSQSSPSPSLPLPPTQPISQTPPSQIRPTATLLANPRTIDAGGVARLAWSSVSTSQCVLSKADGTVLTTGPSDGTFTTSALVTTTVFSLRCATLVGTTVHSSTTVEVRPIVLPIR